MGKMSEKFYSLEKNGNALDVYIFGEITSNPWFDGDVSEHSIISQIAGADVDRIDVHLSSYGGEVKCGVAIYNALKAHKAKVRTIADSLVCSVASVIFMAGDERIMKKASALMVHNAWVETWGNAKELRKAADDLDKITQLSVAAYVENSKLTEEEVKNLLDGETYISPEEALEYGFATAIEESKNANASQSAFMRVIDILKKHKQEADTKEADEDEKPNTDEDETTDSTTDTESGNTDEEETTDEESSDDTEDEPTDEEDGEEDKPDAEQSINTFFNAILKI